MKSSRIYNTTQLKEFLQTFNTSCFAFDTETSSLVHADLEMQGMSLCDGENACYINFLKFPVTELNDVLLILKQLFSNKHKDHVVIGANLVFDMSVLWKYKLDCRAMKWFDVIVASHLIDETRSTNGLKALALDYLNLEMATYAETQKYGPLSKEFEDYGELDAVATYQLFEQFSEMLVNEDLKTLFTKVEMPFQRCLLDARVTGIPFDTKRLEEFKEKASKRIFELEKEMHEVLNKPFSLQHSLYGDEIMVGSVNFKSSKQVSTILFDELELEITHTTDTGAPSVGSDFIEENINKHPVIPLLQEYKKLTKLNSSFLESIPKFIESDGVVRSNYHSTGTYTGRLSCSKPNYQQLPRPSNDPIGIRELLIAPEGKKIIAVDYSGQELRIIAHETRDETMIKAFHNDLDLHLLTARAAFKLDIKDEELINGTKRHKELKEQYYEKRTLAKNINFGISYGAGAHKVSQQMNSTVEEAQAILDDYLEGYPGLAKWIEAVHKAVDECGQVVSLFGRKRRFEKEQYGYTARHKRQATNFLIQSPAADMVRIAGIRCWKRGLKHPEWDLHVIGFVHDEILFTCNEGYAEVVKEAMCEEFSKAVRLVVPTPAEADIGDNYGQAK